MDFVWLSLAFRWICVELSLVVLWIYVGFASDFRRVFVEFSIRFVLAFRWNCVGFMLDVGVIVRLVLGFRWMFVGCSMDFGGFQQMLI